MPNSDDFKICLAAVGKPRSIVSISETDTVEDVKRMAQDSFGGTNVTLKAGFPPRPLEVTTAKARTVFSRNERVQVESAGNESDKYTCSSAKKNGTNTASLASATTSGRRTASKRSAAKAATASFKDVIRAQDEMMKQTASTTKKKSSPNKKRSRPTNSSTASNAAAQRRMARMPGRRLSDGAGVGPPAVQRQPKKASQQATWKSQDDVSFALMSALNTGGGGGKVGQVLRGAMRNAVNNRYEASRAVVRVSAVQSRNFQITEKDDRLVVSFSKGMEGRGMYEETVDLVPREALVAVITAIYNTSEEESQGKEMLRPTNLAQLSPRVFWSLVKDDNSGSSIEEALQQLIPSLDWSYLRRRKTTLSEKAKENLRQQQQQPEEHDVQAGEEAVQAVEQAMEQLHEYDQSRMRERAARAAFSRQEGTTDATSWKLETPTEVDRDELRECIAQQESVQEQQGQINGWIESLTKSGIGNWRQLANADTTTVASIVDLSPQAVEPWLDYAQQQSVEEIIVEICNGQTNAVEILRDEARSGTPRDLASWRSLPSMLYKEAPSLEATGVSAQDVATWCQRAQDVLREYEWLQWYATPVVEAS